MAGTKLEQVVEGKGSYLRERDAAQRELDHKPRTRWLELSLRAG